MKSQLINVRAPIHNHARPTSLTGSGEELAFTNRYGLRDRITGFVTLIRPIFFILTPLNAASAAVLAAGGYPPLSQCVAGFMAVAFTSCAINVGNDYVDRERDKHIWPDRPISSGRVSPGEALLVVIASLIISLSITWFVFNPPTFFILLLAVILGTLYSAYLRNKVGYLSLPPMVGLIYLGGWAAFAPETLFSSWLPWYLYMLGVVWQTAHIMIYYPLHIIPPANKSKAETPRAFFFTPSPQAAVKIGVAFTCLTLLLSAGLFLVVPFSALYLALIIAAGVYALLSGFKLLKDVLNHDRGLKAFAALSRFRLVISAAILISVLLFQVVR